jgi:hypothetical protein
MAGIYPSEFDCVWLATDRNGCLGAFITAGIGPIPKAVFANSNFPDEDFEEYLIELPQISEVEMLVELPRPDSILALASRGLFVFDWSDIHRTDKERINKYELLAKPVHSKSIASLPKKLSDLFAIVKLEQMSFPESETIDIRSFYSCVDS